jgi:23S rRNA (pseudouridine1915-N3)-methyltransferase
MRLTIAAVGRSRESPELALCELYCERARALAPKLGFSKLDLVVIDISRAATLDARMKDEAEKLSAKLPAGAHRIALDEAGRTMGSEAFAKRLRQLADSGTRDLVFLIGGPDGLAPALRESAQERLAFGPQTWPHLLVRAMLAEQIYRGLAILSGHPYHRARPPGALRAPFK